MAVPRDFSAAGEIVPSRFHTNSRRLGGASILVVGKGAGSASDETGHRQISAIPAVGQKFFAAHDPELRQGPGAVSCVSDATRGRAAGAYRDHTHDHSRIRGPSSRSGPAEKLDRAEARGAAIVFQVLRARGPAKREPGAAGAYTEAAQARSFRAFRRRDERLLESACEDGFVAR